MKLSLEKVIGQLEGRGYQFSKFSLSTTGNYTKDDAIWNYQDAVVHIPYVHQLVKNTPITIEKELMVSIFSQKALGFEFPITVVDMLTGPHEQTAITTYGFFVLIVHNQCFSEGENTARVVTYHIGARKWIAWVVPVIQWILRRNYKDLMSTDIPMRERRGALRRLGYEILSDKNPGNYLTAMDLNRKNIGIRSGVGVRAASEIDVKKDLKEGTQFLLGNDDHLGLKLLREGNELRIYRRICLHEGASLDGAKCINKKLQCPWHGRMESAITAIDLTKAHTAVRTEFHEIKFDGTVLQVFPIPMEQAAHGLEKAA